MSRRFVAHIHRDSQCRGHCVPLDKGLQQAMALSRTKPAMGETQENRPQQSFLKTRHEWRFALGLVIGAVSLTNLYILHPPRLWGIALITFYLLAPMVLWGLIRRKHWAARVLVLLLLPYAALLLLTLFPSIEIELSLTSSTVISCLSLFFFTFALPEFYKT